MTFLESFDKTESIRCNYRKPEKYSDLLLQFNTPVIARGAGLSYCSASAMENGLSLDMRSFNRILAFDSKNGLITVEAGTTIGDLNTFVIDHAWLLPVLPGYPMITVGGCIAFNVHGKSQYKIGLFGDWVEELTLYHPSYGEITCSRIENHLIFDLTIGGMGFTGIIISAKLRLRKIAGDRLQVTSCKVGDIREAVRIMEEQASDYDYVYSWNDFNMRNKLFGRGIVYLEKIVPGFSGKHGSVIFRNRLLSRNKTPGILNSFTISWMCRIYYLMNTRKQPVKLLDLSKSSFPIYGKEIYYRLFGYKGFREYQVIFPRPDWESALDEIRLLIREMRMGIALASLKLFSGQSHHISFSGEGICLALDIPNNGRSIEFFDQLDQIVIKYHGRVNISKDSRARHELIKKVFDGYQEFKDRIHEYDPKHYFESALRSRLKI